MKNTLKNLSVTAKLYLFGSRIDDTKKEYLTDEFGKFENIEQLRIMKDVRNTIAHEYIEDDLTAVFEEVLEYMEKLINIINTTLLYIEKRQ